MNHDPMEIIEEISANDEISCNTKGLHKELMNRYVVKPEEVDSTIQDLFAEQLILVSMALSSAFEKVTSATRTKMEAMRRVELEALRLCRENRRLRAQIAGAGLTIDGHWDDGNSRPPSRMSGSGISTKTRHRDSITAHSPCAPRTPPSSRVWPLQMAPRPPTPSEAIPEPEGSIKEMHIARTTTVKSWTSEGEATETQVVEIKPRRAKNLAQQEELIVNLSSEREATGTPVVEVKPRNAWKLADGGAVLTMAGERPRNGLERSGTLRGTAQSIDEFTAPSTPVAIQHFASNKANHPADESTTPSSNGSVHRVASIRQAMKEHLGQRKSGGPKGSFSRTSQVRHNNIARSAFVDADEMKQRVRDAIGKKDYNVHSQYHTTGLFQYIAKSSWFELTTFTVIGINSIWLGVETDMNPAPSLADSDVGFKIVENIFCIFFLFEWIVRFGAFRSKITAFMDKWFLFDSLLMAAMILDTWAFTLYVALAQQRVTSIFNPSVLKLLKLARLTRMARVAKLVRATPELVCLVKGMFVAFRSVGFTMVLLLLVLYAFGIAFTQLARRTVVGTTYYPTVRKSIVSLTLHGIFLEGLPEMVIMTGDEHLLLGVLLIVFVMLASVTVMNMLTGLLVQVVSVVSQVEKEANLIGYIKNHLQEQLARMPSVCVSSDEDQDAGSITRERFELLLTSRESAQALAEVGVDVESLVDLLDFIFQGEVSLSFAKVIEIVLDLRGNKMASVKDIVDLRNYMTQELASGLLCIEANISQMITVHGQPVHSGHVGRHSSPYKSFVEV